MPRAADERLGRPRWLAPAGIAVSVIAVAAVIAWASGQPAPELPERGSELRALVAALGLMSLATLLRSERWRGLVAQSGGLVGHRESFGITVVGFMGNTVLPVRGGDLLRVVLARSRARIGTREAIGTLLAERLLDVVILLAAFLILAYGILRGIETPGGGPLALLGGAIGIVLLLGAWLRRARGEHDWARRLVGFIAPMGAATRDLFSAHGLAMLSLTVLLWTVEAAVWYACGEAVGLDLAPVEALYLVALAAVFLLIPSGPGYAGTLDAAVVFGVRAIGYGGGAALSFLIVLRFVLMVPLTIGGGLLVLLRYGGPAMLRVRREAV